MKTASAAAIDSAITRRVGLRLIGPDDTRVAGLSGRVGATSRRAAARHAIAVIVAERARRLLGERVAVALAVRRPHEGRDDVEAPVGDLGRLPPEVGQAEVDVELEQVDPRGVVGHGKTVEKASDGLGWAWPPAQDPSALRAPGPGPWL